VSLKIYTAADFPNPPVDAATFNLAISTFGEAKASQGATGKLGTAVKNEKRAALLPMVRDLADCVDKQSGNNLSTLLSSGFEAASTNRTRTELATPTIQRITPGSSGESRLTVTAIRNAKTYEVQVAVLRPDNTPGTFVTVAIVTSSRNIPAGNLIPGTVYLFQVRAIGGLTGASDWSDAVMQRVM
jgi:hypothetical protein